MVVEITRSKVEPLKILYDLLVRAWLVLAIPLLLFSEPYVNYFLGAS